MKTTFLKLILSLNLIVAMPCLSAEASIPLRGFHVGQERLERNGVLISRPIQSDRAIVDIVSQNQIHTLEDYAAWLEKNIIYQPTSLSNSDQAPTQKIEEFLKIKRGNCTDFAFLNSQVLRVLGFTPHILALYAPDNAHAICAFEYNGKFYWFDNATLKTSTATDLVAFAQEISNEFHYSKSFELDPASKQSNLIYEHS